MILPPSQTISRFGDDRIAGAYDWQAIVEEAVRLEAKVAWQNPYCNGKAKRFSYKYRSPKYEKCQDQRNIQAKRSYFPITNNNCKNGGKFDQVSDWCSNKDDCSNKIGQQGQFSNTPTIGGNATIIKKNRKQNCQGWKKIHLIGVSR